MTQRLTRLVKQPDALLELTRVMAEHAQSECKACSADDAEVESVCPLFGVPDEAGRVPLLVCCVHNRKEYAEMLCDPSLRGSSTIKAVANEAVQFDIHKRNALHYALFHGWKGLAETLISSICASETHCIKGVLGERDYFGRSSLHIAIVGAHEKFVHSMTSMNEFEALSNVNDILERILEVAGEHLLDAVDSLGFTPLHLAAKSGFSKTVELLLAIGADPSIMAYNGHCAAFSAANTSTSPPDEDEAEDFDGSSYNGVLGRKLDSVCAIMDHHSKGKQKRPMSSLASVLDRVDIYKNNIFHLMCPTDRPNGDGGRCDLIRFFDAISNSLKYDNPNGACKKRQGGVAQDNSIVTGLTSRNLYKKSPLGLAVLHGNIELAAVLLSALANLYGVDEAVKTLLDTLREEVVPAQQYIDTCRCPEDRFDYSLINFCLKNVFDDISSYNVHSSLAEHARMLSEKMVEVKCTVEICDFCCNVVAVDDPSKKCADNGDNPSMIMPLEAIPTVTVTDNEAKSSSDGLKNDEISWEGKVYASKQVLNTDIRVMMDYVVNEWKGQAETSPLGGSTAVLGISWDEVEQLLNGSKNGEFEKVTIKQITDERNPVFSSDRIQYGLYAKEFIGSGSLLGEYTGEVELGRHVCEEIDRTGQDRRYCAYLNMWDTQIASYHCECSALPVADCEHLMVDAETCRNELAFINDPKPDRVANAKFVYAMRQGWPHVVVVTCRPIEKDEEILVDYGEDYWQVATEGQ